MKRDRTILLLAVVLSFGGIRSITADDPDDQAERSRQEAQAAYDDAFTAYNNQIGNFNRVVVQQLPKGRYLSEDDLKKLSPEARKEVAKLLKDRTDEPAPAGIDDATREVYLKAVKQLNSLSEPKVYHYMIGVSVDKPEGEADKSDEAGGVQVSNVVEATPAAKAGMKEGDRILKVGETKIESIEGLMDAVEASQGEKLSLTYRRGDEEKTIEIKPIARPQEYLLDYSKSLEDNLSDEEALRNFRVRKSTDVNGLLRNLAEQPGNAPNADIRLHAVHPGIVLRWVAGEALPENLSIKIEKTGNRPAKVTVTRKEQSWDVTEESLDQLPEDLRPYVQRMLGNSERLTWQAAPVSPPVVRWVRPEEVHSGNAPSPEKQFEKPDSVIDRVNELQQQLEKQSQLLRELTEQLKAQRKDEKNDE